MSGVENELVSSQEEAKKEDDAALSEHHHVHLGQYWRHASYNVQMQKQLERYYIDEPLLMTCCYDMYLVQPEYDQDDEGKGGDQLLPDFPLGGVKGVANHPTQHEETPEPSQPAHCLHYLQEDFEGLWMSVTQFHAESVINSYV